MKLSNVEGTAEELTDFFQNNGLKVTDYFQPPEAPLKTTWLVVPAVVVFLALATLAAFPSLGTNYQKLAFVTACFATIWWAVAIQIRFRNPWATGVVIVGCVVLTLVAMGLLSPTQVLDEVKALKK